MVDAEPQQASSSGVGLQSLENNRNTCVEQRGQRFRGSQHGGNSYRPMDDPEKVDRSIQSRNIWRNRGHVTDR